MFVNAVPTFIQSFFSGHERTVNIKKNVVFSIFLRGLNIFINLITVRLAIDYLDPARYGLWLTISSVIAWFGFFNIGLGHGLRNKFAQCLINNDTKLAKTYVSTTYAILILIFSCLSFFFFLCNPYLNWAKLLNADPALAKEISVIALIVFSFFCTRLVLNLVTSILLADQRTALAYLIATSGRILNLIILIALTFFSNSSLLYLCIAFSSTPVFVLFVFTIYLFTTDYRNYKPSIKYVDFNYTKDLIGLGGQFFILQIAVIVIYATDNILISQLFDPSYVTPYHISRRYFDLVLMGFAIIIAPLWSAITEAYHTKDFYWIKRSIRKLNIMWYYSIFIIIIMVLISNWIYRVWIGDKIDISLFLSISMAFYVVVRIYSTIYTNFLNGVGKLRISILTATSAIIFNIPLSILFASTFKLGISGVILATAFFNLLTGILRLIQYNKIMNQTAIGIWNK